MKPRIAIVLLSAGLIGGCVKDQVASNRPGTSPNDAPIIPDAPLTANTHFAAGQLDESQGAADPAVMQYEDAARLDPKATPALLRLGIIYTASKKYDLAVNAWNRYIKATNGSAAAYNDLGFTLELANRLPEAEAAFKAGIAREPHNQACRVNYGLMLAHQGRLDEATAQMSVVLSTAQVHYNIASVLESQGKKAAARAEFREAIAIDPAMNDAKQRLAGLDRN